jgi:hypothetical protein
MKINPDWESFKSHPDRIHPRFNETIPLDLDQPGL